IYLFKQGTPYEICTGLEFRRVLFGAPSVTASPSARKVSSYSRPNVDVKNCRLVAYSFNKSIVSETLCDKLKTDLSRLSFQTISQIGRASRRDRVSTSD